MASPVEQNVSLSPPPKPSCPKCRSESIQAVAVNSANVTHAAVTELALGTAAGLAASRNSSIKLVCLACGCSWAPGSETERLLRSLSGQLGPKAKADADAKVSEGRQAALKRERRKKNMNAAANWLIGVGIAILAIVWMVSNSR